MSENPAGPQAGPSSAREPAEAAAQYRLARDEELRRLEIQRSELDGMRSRTAQYLAFVGAATSFLVGNGLAAPDRDLVFFLIAGTSTIVSGMTVYLAVTVFTGGWNIRKRKVGQWAFTLAPLTVLRAVEAEIHRPNESQINGYVARLYAQMADTNTPVLNRVRRLYVIFLAVGAAQIVGWTILLWARA